MNTFENCQNTKCTLIEFEKKTCNLLITPSINDREFDILLKKLNIFSFFNLLNS